MFAAAVAAGVAAVEAVAAGYRGDPALLDGTGFEVNLGWDLDRDHLIGLANGSSVYAGLSMKPFCSAKQSVAAVEALRIILRAGVAPDAIAAMKVRVPPAYAGMIATKAQDGVRTSTLVSVARQLALLANAPAQLYDIDRSTPVTDATILAFEAKVEIVAEPELAQYYPRHWPAEVEVVTADGKSRRERVIEAPGDPGRPLDDAALEVKAHGVLDRLIGRDATAALIATGRKGLADEAGCRALSQTFAAVLDARD